MSCPIFPCIYLASASPRRYELLTLLAIPFEKLSINVVELKASGESPQEYVNRLALSKAQAGVQAAEHDYPVLGADTIVVLDGEVLEKPTSKQQAAQMLRRLSGRCHLVITAIAFADRQIAISQQVSTEVCFCHLCDDEILDYIASNEPMDKAGSYAIQGYGGRFVRSINGSYHAVVGLPLVETKELLNAFLALKEQQ